MEIVSTCFNFVGGFDILCLLVSTQAEVELLKCNTKQARLLIGKSMTNDLFSFKEVELSKPSPA